MTLFAAILLAACTGRSHSDTGGGADTGSEAVAADLALTVHPDVSTILVATWTQKDASSASWVEYSFGDTILQTPVIARSAGPAREVLLGIPANTAVTATVHSESDSSAPVISTTGALPDDLPTPEVLTWDPVQAASAPWMMVSVDVGTDWYKGPFYIVILDRQGEIVWYWQVPGGRSSLYAQPGWDGTHLVVDANATFVFTGDLSSEFYRLTLDLARLDEIPLPDLNFAFDDETGGAVLYCRQKSEDHSWVLTRHNTDGTDTDLWSCSDVISGSPYLDMACAANTVVWDADRDTVLYSLPFIDTVFEVDLETNTVIRQFGTYAEGWTVDPSGSLDLQHYANWTPDGTILLSTHDITARGEMFAREFAVDDASQTLNEQWTYSEDTYYASESGEAVRLDNGNTLIGYGTGGAAVEVTPAGDVVWELVWPANPDTGTTLIGHATLLDDLYALNGETPDAEGSP